MEKPSLRTDHRWVPMKGSEAERLGLSVKPFAPVHRAEDFGLISDQSVWFEARLPSRWLAAFRLANQRGQPVIAELRVFPDDGGKHHPGEWRGTYGTTATVPPGGLSARVLRQIRTRAFRKALRNITTNILKASERQAADPPAGSTVADGWREQLDTIFPGVPISSVPPRTGHGRKGRSDHELARIAAVYERAYLADRPSIDAVAKAHRLSLTRARDAVRRARARGLLTGGGKQGEGGGRLTPLAQKLLNRNVKASKPRGGKHHGPKR